MDETEPPKMSRRQLIKMLTTAVAVQPFLVESQREEPTKKAKETKQAVKEVRYTKIDGVEVFGLNNAVDSLEGLDLISRAINNRFKAEVRNRLNVSTIPETMSIQEQRELVLDPKERYLQLFVTERMWQKFNEEKAGGGLSFIEWMQCHVELMNEMFNNAVPTVDLKTVLKRVILVSDKFDTRNPDKIDPGGTPLAFDVDGQRVITWDLRGEVNPYNGQQDKSSYLKLVSRNGVSCIVDYGEIHEWAHQLYSTLDEYRLWVDNIEPRLFLMGDIYQEGYYNKRGILSTWLAFALNRINQLKIRGYYIDHRSMGEAGYRDVEDSASKVLGLFPDRNTLMFFDENGVAINGKLGIKKCNYTNDLEKSWEDVGEIQINDGTFTLDNQLFEPAQVGDKLFFPTNWLLKINQDDGREHTLHITSQMLNIAQLSGVKDAVYKVTILNERTDPIDQFLEATTKDVYQEKEKPLTQFAKIEIEGTNFVCVYY